MGNLPHRSLLHRMAESEIKVGLVVFLHALETVLHAWLGFGNLIKEVEHRASDNTIIRVSCRRSAQHVCVRMQHQNFCCANGVRDMYCVWNIAHAFKNAPSEDELSVDQTDKKSL
jgi:hypothetical protein